jgi:hypothetical protein
MRRILLSSAVAILITSTAPAQTATDPASFRWQEIPGESIDLWFGNRLVLRYMNAKHQSTPKDQHELTFKVFHHVLDPKEGKILLTSGPGLASDKTLLYPHHRGLFFGFNRISYAGHPCDNWHGAHGEFQNHEKTLTLEAAPDQARQRAQIGWHGQDGQKFAEEKRELSAFRRPEGTLLEWSSRVTTQLPKVRLDGDPQHAGFHFRASQEVAQKTKSQTYFLRPDGKGALGETRNWDPKTRRGPVNLPWDTMSFVVAGQRFTVLYLDHPGNPKEARGSERDYGRIGSYFEYDLTPTRPLAVRYRIWVQRGEMTVNQCESMSREFRDTAGSRRPGS